MKREDATATAQPLPLPVFRVPAGAQFDCATEFATDYPTQFSTELPVKSYSNKFTKWKYRNVSELGSAIELSPWQLSNSFTQNLASVASCNAFLNLKGKNLIFSHE